MTSSNSSQFNYSPVEMVVNSDHTLHASSSGAICDQQYDNKTITSVHTIVEVKKTTDGLRVFGLAFLEAHLTY